MKGEQLPPRGAMHRDTPPGSRLTIANAYAIGDITTREQWMAAIDFEAVQDLFVRAVRHGNNMAAYNSGMDDHEIAADGSEFFDDLMDLLEGTDE